MKPETTRLGQRAFFCSLLLALVAVSAGALPPIGGGNQKVKVCHIPPGNPANFHTITISSNALEAHLAHGDLPGSCAQYCDQLCSDGNPCTIDACDANEHCLADHPPVDCNDSNLCTFDSCNPAAGCEYAPVTCDDGQNCTVAACDPMTGSCVAPPVDCAEGQSCDPATGECTEDDPCEDNPCVNGDCLAPPGGGYFCECLPGWTGTHCDIQEDPCANVTCPPATNQCREAPVCSNGVCGGSPPKPDETPCDDGDPNSFGDSCIGGVCRSNTW